MKKIIAISLMALALAGCGEESTENNYQPTPGDGIAIEQTGDGTLLVENVEGDKYEITCEGECGDIIINSTPPLDTGIPDCNTSSDEDYKPEIDGDCADGFWWCPDAGLCKTNS